MPRPSNSFRNLVLGLAVGVLAFALVPMAVAQTDVTTSRVTGVVRDTNGAPLPGATVEVRNQGTGLVQRVITDPDGSFRVLNLPTGNYTVSASLEGFTTAEQKDIRVLLNQVPTIDFRLPLSKVAESITVTAQVPLVEVTNTAASLTVQTEQIKQLPIVGRNFTNLILAAPETTTSNERNYISLSGQRGINTSIVVDGVDDNNPFFGGAIGQAENRAPLQISEESIKEFSVITNGASVEFGRAGGGFINVVTKNGTNDLKGSVFYYDQPQSMLAKRADGTSLPDQKKKQYGFSLGGPFIKDQLFFFTSYDQQKQTVNFPILATAYDPAVAAKYPYFTSGTNFDQTQDGRVLFGRVDYQATGAQRLTGRVNYADYTGDNGTSSAAYNATGHNGIEHMWARSYVASYSGVFSENWLNDANAEWVIEDTPRLAKNNQYPEIQVFSGGADFGGVSFLPINPTKVERKSLSDTVTYLHKDHVFKAGFEYNDTSVDQIFKGNWRGVYIFPNQAAFLAGKWTQYRQFGGLNGLTADQAGRVNFGQKESAAFLQDQWYVSPSVTASLGLRWENLNNPNDAVLNPNSVNANGSYNLNGQIPDTKNQWSPRFGLTWSPAASGTTVLRLSGGRFWSRTPALLFSQLYSSNGLRGTQYNISTAAGVAPTDPLSPGWGANFDPTLLAPIDFSKVPNPTGLGVFTIAPNFKNPYTDRITAGWDQEIVKDTAINVDFTYAKTYQLERLTDLNLQYAYNPDGTLKLSPINGQPMFTGTSPSARPDHYYSNIREYVSDAQSKYTAVVVTLHRRFTERLFGFAAVTWSQDFDNDSNERNYSGPTAEDQYDLNKNWGYSVRDQRWKIGLNGVWNTPWWGVSFSGVYYYNTGSPFTPTTTTDANKDGNYTDRPTINGVHLARDSYRYPDSSGINLRLQKAFDLGPGKVAAIVECFNCTNNANWTVSSTTWGDGQTPLANFDKANIPTSYVRTFQLALRYDF